MTDVSSAGVRTRRPRSLQSSFSSTNENSFPSPRGVHNFLEREKQLKKKRSAAINLKSFLVQSLISAACFAEFYQRPFDVFIKQRILFSLYVWVAGVIFLGSACLCFFYYLVYKCSSMSLPKSKKLQSPCPAKWVSPNVTPKLHSNASPNNASFICVRLSPQTTVLSPGVMDTSNLNMSRNQSARFNSSGHRHNSFLEGSFNRDSQTSVLSPSNSYLSNSSFRGQQLYQGSTCSRKPNSVLAAAEQSFHLSPMSASPLSTSRVLDSSQSFIGEEKMYDRKDLEKYLHSFYQQEAETLAALEGTRMLFDSPSSRMLRNMPNDRYQMCQAPDVTESNVSPLKNSSSATSLLLSNPDIVLVDGLAKYNVGNKIQNWVEHLRKWISATILKPLVKAIADTNQALEQNGVTEVKLGRSNVSSFGLLRQQNIEMLEKVLRYVDVTPNQEYLLTRLETLSADSCMSAFAYSSGGSHNGKAWNETLPTDTEIIIHIFMTYIDQHLLTHASHVMDNRFKATYFVPFGQFHKKLKENKKILLAQTSCNPPVFVVIFKDKVMQLPEGSYNLFHAILLFLFLHDRHNYGQLDTVSLGSAGINVSWIFSG